MEAVDTGDQSMLDRKERRLSKLAFLKFRKGVEDFDRWAFRFLVSLIELVSRKRLKDCCRQSSTSQSKKNE